jgi:hypothetical protein
MSCTKMFQNLFLRAPGRSSMIGFCFPERRLIAAAACAICFGEWFLKTNESGKMSLERIPRCSPLCPVLLRSVDRRSANSSMLSRFAFS